MRVHSDEFANPQTVSKTLAAALCWDCPLSQRRLGSIRHGDHFSPPATAATQPPNTYTEPLGTSLEGWPYPGPLQFLPLTMEGQQVRMAYMDFRSPIRWQMTYDGHEKAKVGIAGQQ